MLTYYFCKITSQIFGIKSVIQTQFRDYYYLLGTTCHLKNTKNYKIVCTFITHRFFLIYGFILDKFQEERAKNRSLGHIQDYYQIFKSHIIHIFCNFFFKKTRKFTLVVVRHRKLCVIEHHK